jgi:hypothetical protein
MSVCMCIPPNCESLKLSSSYNLGADRKENATSEIYTRRF